MREITGIIATTDAVSRQQKTPVDVQCLYQTHPSLQAVSLPQCQRVSFGNDWDNVDFAVNGLHELHIQRLKTGKNTEPELVYPAFKHAHIKPLL